MPRANRYFLPGHAWHLTHRCHKKEFLLKFARDRRNWRRWLFEARKRYGLCVLNYIATSNHIHLLVRDQGRGEIAQSMQLIAGRTGQEYNQRKGRKGAYWEDRYHATAVDVETYLARCMTYIDLNMVRAGVVRHPAEWEICGYGEIQRVPQRYAVIDQMALMDAFGLASPEQLRRACHDWVEETLRSVPLQRDVAWTECLAVGRPAFVQDVKSALGIKARHRDITDHGGKHVLRETAAAYTYHLMPESGSLSAQNTIVWK